MKYPTQKGFTLVEMLAVLAIFAVLTSVVVFNYSRFRSETILTNMAYEIALSIREAQIYGVSARGVKNSPSASPDFSIPYGVFFRTENTNQYILFGDTQDDLEFSGTDCSDTGGDTCITPYTLQGNITITDVRVESGGNCPSISNLSLVFKRPNPEPIINNDPNISRAQITVSAPGGESNRYIVIANNGQVSVKNNPLSCAN